MKRNIIILTNFLLSFVLIFLFIIPKWNYCSLLANKVSGAQVELDRLNEWVNKIDELKKDYQNLESEARDVLLALPKEEDIPNLLVQFEAIALDNNLILESMSFGQIVEQDKSVAGASIATGQVTRSSSGSESSHGISQKIDSSLRELSVDISVGGTYDNFKNYLNSLSKNMRSMDVEYISLNNSNLNKSGEKIVDYYKFDLAIVVYYQ
ncbi:type 4a pilus biogenesis protein PilO [Patescibacteria group bacterium]